MSYPVSIQFCLDLTGVRCIFEILSRKVQLRITITRHERVYIYGHNMRIYTHEKNVCVHHSSASRYLYTNEDDEETEYHVRTYARVGTYHPWHERRVQFIYYYFIIFFFSAWILLDGWFRYGQVRGGGGVSKPSICDTHNILNDCGQCIMNAFVRNGAKFFFFISKIIQSVRHGTISIICCIWYNLNNNIHIYCNKAKFKNQNNLVLSY